MADIKIVGGKGLGREECEDKHDHKDRDCDCHVDHVTLAGKGTKHHPFKVIGNPMWPPFPTILPGQNVTTTIYANQTGSDTSGKGTPAEPYRTFARAILDVPQVINPGYRFVIDITNLGVETLPQDYAAPPIVSQEFTWTDEANANPPYFSIRAAFQILAMPQLLSSIPAADAEISAADAAVVSVVGPNLVKLTIGAARASWVAGTLKGALVVKTQGDRGTPCTVFDNTTTELWLTNNPGNFNGGVGPLVLQPGEVVQIVEPSATLQAFAADDLNKDAFEFTGLGSLICSGVQFQGVNPNTGEGGLGIAGTTQPIFELCVLNEFTGDACGLLQLGIFACVVRGYFDTFGAGYVTVSRSYFDQVGQSFRFDLNGANAGWRRSVFDECLPVGNASDALELGARVLLLNECWLRGSLGDAVSITSPTPLYMDNVQIDDAGGNAIMAIGPLRAALNAVTGTGNAGYGLFADDGVHAKVDAATVVVGASGAYTTDGGTTPVAAWPVTPNNDTNPTTLTRVWSP
jgi:hypothetical protein